MSETGRVDVDVTRRHLRVEVGDVLKVARIRKVPTMVVYFLLRDGDVVYVGRSGALYWRLGHHQRDKDFDSWAYVELEPKQALHVERFLVDALQPEYNDRGNFGAKENPALAWDVTKGNAPPPKSRKPPGPKRPEGVAFGSKKHIRWLKQNHARHPRAR